MQALGQMKEPGANGVSLVDASHMRALIYDLSYWELNCLGSLVVLSATATLEVLGLIPRSSKKCYWVFL